MAQFRSFAHHFWCGVVWSGPVSPGASGSVNSHTQFAKQVAKRAVICWLKLAYFAECHARHKRVNCVICEMKKCENANAFTH